MFDRISDWWYEAKNEACNKIIQFCAKHCCLYATTLYSIARKTYREEIEFVLDDLEKEKNGG